MIEITLSPGDPVLFKKEDLRHYRGYRLPGSILKSCRRVEFSISVQDYTGDYWAISTRNYSFASEAKFVTKESLNWLRIEIILTGKLSIRTHDKKVSVLHANQYHVTDAQYYQAHLSASSECNFIVVYISPEYLQHMKAARKLVPCVPRTLPEYMNKKIFDILNNRYNEDLQYDFYYSCIWSLVFYHLTGVTENLPEHMTKDEAAAIYSADNKIAENLNVHLSTRELARQTGIQEHKLILGFKAIFGKSSFERLMDRRMELASRLLATTDMDIKEVSVEAGYSNVSAFGSGFKKRFGMPPGEWRKNQKGTP